MRRVILSTAIILFSAVSLYSQKLPFNTQEVIMNITKHPEVVNKIGGPLSGEFLLDSNFIYIPEPSDQRYPSVAFDGTNYLVVWFDQRGDDDDIYGTRISTSGRILDPNGFPISAAAYNQTNPQVIFDGTNFFVVWQDRRSGYPNDDIFGARVSPAGVVLDPNGIAISTASNNQSNASLAFNNTDYFVIWQDGRNTVNDIYGARVTTFGELLDPSGIAISTAENRQEAPSIAFDGTNLFAVWEDRRRNSLLPDIFGSRISLTGVVLDTLGIAITTATNYQQAPSIAFDGTNYLAVWEDARNTRNIYGSRISRSGTVLDTGIIISDADDDQRNPSVTFDGSNYFVVWQDQRNYPDLDIYGTEVSPSGTVLNPSGIAISIAENNQQEPSIIFGYPNYLIVWTDDRHDPYDFDIYGTRVSSNGILIDSLGIVISSSADPYTQSSPSVAFDGTNYFAVWTDERNGNQDIFGARVDQAGMILDPISIAITTDTNNQYSSSVAFDGTNYLVVWTDERNFSVTYTDIYGTRVSQSGFVLDPAGIVISNGIYDQESPVVAFDNLNYLVVWEDRRNGNYNRDIYGTRVNQSGVILEPAGIAISNSQDNQEAPSIAFDGNNYLAVWQDYRSGDDYNIFGTRISPNGTVLEPGGIPISTSSRYQESSSVTFNGSNYLVVWQDERELTSDIYGARVSPSGDVLDPFGFIISNANNHQRQPSVTSVSTSTGPYDFVVWQDLRNDSFWDIYGTKLDLNGSIIDTFPISIQSKDQVSPALVNGPQNQMLITFSGWVDSINNIPANVMRIWGKLFPGPGIEEQHTTTYTSRFISEIFPNPFSKQTKIRFIPNASPIELKIYDISGKQVKSFTTNPQPLTTSPCLVWDGSDDSNQKLPNGVYIARFKTRIRTETKQIIILR
jgi:hypothetical protein